MTLRYAILGFLTFEDLSGYDLKTRYFDGSVGNFYPAHQRQIYRELEQLEQEGWAVSRLEIQEGKPNRRVYTITEAGRNALRNWLKESQPLEVIRMPFLVQFYFLRESDKASMLALLADQLQQHQQTLAFYHDIDLPALDDPAISKATLFGPLVLDFGIRFEQMQIEWLEDTIKHIKHLPDEGSA